MSRMRFSLPIAAVSTVAALLLTGCAAGQGQIERPSQAESFQPPAAQPELHPDGTAADNLPYFHETLRQFGVGEAPVQGMPVVDQLAAAGFDKEQMQVSFDESKTGLVADNIFVSVRFGQECLIGQIVVADRTFVTEAAQAIGPEQNICLIGATRTIDW